MNNLYKLTEGKGYVSIINNKNSSLTYLGLDHIFLETGKKLEHEFADVESTFILQAGDFKASIESKNGKVLRDITGSRSNVFNESPTVIYIPPQSKIIIETNQGLDALVYSSPSDKNGCPIYIKPNDIVESVRGALNWKRKVRVIFGPQSETNNIIIGESVSVPGGWIGFPPHKHDTEGINEYPLDEIYFFKVTGPHGAYALHHTYDSDKKFEEHYTIDKDSAIAIPKGFHTTLAVPGCRLYMLWGLAGKKKIYKLSYDERFTWLNDSEALF
jgi:5-deoxy-glucuronate isomerase